MTTPISEYLEIPLTEGFSAKVDLDDFLWLNQWKWNASRSGKSLQSRYAQRKGVCQDGVVRTIRMHRLILGLGIGDKRHGDHINGDTLDNRRVNLRVASHAENQRNKGLLPSNTSGFKGVSWFKRDQVWQAKITHAAKQIHLGYFKTPEDAHRAYCNAAVQLHGDFVRHT